MNYSLASIGLSDASLIGGTLSTNFKIIFDAMTEGSVLSIHIKEDGNLSTMCPDGLTRGLLTFIKIDTTIASATFMDRVTTKQYTGVYSDSTDEFLGWTGVVTNYEKQEANTPLDLRVVDLENSVGDITLVEHYGGNLVDILNKYTRQVLTDSSLVANALLLKDYYGNIHSITYNTPILVQANNSSINGEATVKFEKDVYADGVLIETLEEEYPLKIIDLVGSWDTYRDLQTGDMVKNIFYNLVKRQAMLIPDDPESLAEIFVLVPQSGESEFGSLSDRVLVIEGFFAGNVFTAPEVVATTLNIGTLNNTTTATLANTIINGTLSVSGHTTLASVSTTSLNLSLSTVTFKGSPGSADPIPKSYVDAGDTATLATINSRFKVGTADPTVNPPAGSNNGDFYFQI